MNIPNLTVEEMNELRAKIAGLRGRNWKFGTEIILNLAPNSPAARVACQLEIEPDKPLTYKEMFSVDVSGSIDACVELMEWIFGAQTDWSINQMNTYHDGTTHIEGPYYCQFNLDGWHINENGWTACGSMLNAIALGAEHLIRDKNMGTVERMEWNQLVRSIGDINM